MCVTLTGLVERTQIKISWKCLIIPSSSSSSSSENPCCNTGVTPAAEKRKVTKKSHSSLRLITRTASTPSEARTDWLRHFHWFVNYINSLMVQKWIITQARPIKSYLTKRDWGGIYGLKRSGNLITTTPHNRSIFSPYTLTWGGRIYKSIDRD